MIGRKGTGICAALIACVLLALPVHTAAQDQQPSVTPTPSQTANSALQVGPAIIERVLDPGKPTPFSLQIKNITNFPLPIKGFVRDMNPEAAKLPDAERERLDASKWFTITEPDFILQPNQVRTVQGSITAPLQVTPGGHYATIFFQPLVPEVALSPSTAYISARVGVLAFLVVKGDLTQKLTISSPIASQKLQRHGPLNLTFSLANTGNVHILPTGFVRIYNWRGTEVGKIALTPGVVLPGTTREYSLKWGTDDIVGQYSVELDLQYGDDKTELHSEVSPLWIIPWIEALVIMGIVGGWILIRRKTKRRWGKAWKAFNGR